MRPPSSSPPPRRAAGDQPSSGASYPGAHRGMAGTLTPDFFAEALDAAMALVHADSGELATLDDSRQRLVLRARRTHPMIDPNISGFSSKGPMGEPSRPSQPLIGHETPASIEQQSTELLPGVLLTRMYRPGERLIGFTWQRGEPVIMRGEDCRQLPGGTAPADTEAPWHLAVPIHRPGPFLDSPAARPIIGMIAVHNRDPLWSFSPRDVELLMLHADRVACSMMAVEMTHLHEGQSALLEMLRGEGSDHHDDGLPALYVRVRDMVRQMFPAPTFALVNYQPEEHRLTFALAERDEHAVVAAPIPLEAAPRWWSVVRAGRAVVISAPEDRAAYPEYCVLGWGSEEPVQSLLAAPLMLGKKLLGAIVVGSANADTYAPESARLLETVGQSAAVVIEHARLEDERNRSMRQAQSRATQLAVLNDAVMTLNQSLDLDDTLDRLEDQASGLTTHEQVCRVFLLDDAGEALVARATGPRRTAAGGAPPPREDAAEEVRIPLTWHDLGPQLAQQPWHVLTDLDAEWGEPTALGRMLRAGRVREALIVPVVREKDAAETVEHGEAPTETLGALWVYTPEQRYHVHGQEVLLLAGLAGQAAVAVHNARQYRELEQAYERQKELDRYKDEFILTVSHEFRTPLTAIDGYVSLISRHGERLEPSKLETFAGEIRQASGQLASMINMLADANRMNEPMNLTLRPTQIAACVATARGRLPPEAQARLHGEPPTDLWVNADAERLTQVLSNLISNALKYSPPTQPCTLSAEIERRETLARAGRPHAQAPGAAPRWVVVSVSDRGEGISAEDQARLFQRFVRLQRSLTTSVRGTGLGLWICRQYVEAMGGDIWVESVVRQGSSFRFCLPAITAPGTP